MAKCNLNGAIADFTKVIDLGHEHCLPGAGTYLKPDCEIAYENRGRAKRRKGDVEGGATDHAKAVQIKTDRENLGKALEQRRSRGGLRRMGCGTLWRRSYHAGTRFLKT